MTDILEVDLLSLSGGIPDIPDHPPRSEEVPHAPKRHLNLSQADFKLALQNALRYFPTKHHLLLGPEFANELRVYGHIYMYRFRPTLYEMRAYPIELYPTQCAAAASMMVMIMNNLDKRVAQFPHELITYGGNGSVFQNWAQYHLVMKYLSQLTEEQTLVLYSGHPLGIFPSPRSAPRCVITNGMVIPNYSTREMYDKMYATGVSQYGQMTAGSFCYIGPQGIVHGTTITILNAARKYLTAASAAEGSNSSSSSSSSGEDGPTAQALLAGRVYISSGLGGMSGAQPKAGVIAGCVCVIAEIDGSALWKRHKQGWLNEVTTSTDECIARIKTARHQATPVSIGYLGNVVDLWEALVVHEATTGEMLVDLGSDQTSLHNPFGGGYYPVGLGLEAGKQLMREEPEEFKAAVEESLRRHVTAVNALASKGMRFWDYGNGFLLEASRAGADVRKATEGGGGGGGGGEELVFRYPSYVQDIMGDIFSLGFGPFRWVCTSCDPADLATTDRIAAEVLSSLLPAATPRNRAQLEDNLVWIRQALTHELVVGSQARILYAHREARAAIAVAFNAAVARGELRGPVVLSRDHHDVSGTDSPFRETSNVTDGSHFCADMAVHNAIGDSFRGATWVALHNGGGVGWGEVTNGGFGLLLDGSEEARAKAQGMLDWDVNNGVSRRAWGMNANAEDTIRREMEHNPRLRVTLPNHSDDALLDSLALDLASA